ncbi:phosphoglucosamine mutase [Ponticaulis sp.]|uniref:phosphoglucosamine mutase n=1 Tax=Ponticaulis sp. TaxID=2020902 RepID=UPI000B74D517|nr:phosphoglucosamine mutase [Ponticaulis sp.]MAI89471.1 phosphoglucosamine mutase [Ponticaulis sp.]OUY00508.1 MAG: phosphoglucosamine mutase [Hyphomonadaceae bacterium TMED5]|tara:strand:- start:121150 stop:122502 length:1353 start_codon:yes stop_codon:yes gene_type:complete
MADQLFGTDGIRGRVNEGAIRPAMFVRFGEALAHVLLSEKVAPTVLIGRDTRKSGEMIQSAIEAGLLNAGANVVRGGVLPTPAVGWLTKHSGASAGLMITASHNPYPDNGVKAFGPDGFKLSGAQQDQIEAIIQDQSVECNVDVARMGSVFERYDYAEEYQKFASGIVSDGVRFDGMSVCVDAANGAGAFIARDVFEKLGANVFMLGCEPDGVNINLKCGALHPEKLAQAVLDQKSHLGIGFDGDADRILLVDETGQVVDGDQIMGAIGLDYHEQGLLKGNTVVATIMSNLGLEAALRSAGITLDRTKVGDRYVVERMREGGFVVGGEQSGHVVLAEHVTTGDAIISALKIMEIMARKSKPASEVLSVFEPVPQILKNVRFKSEDPLETEQVKDAINSAKDQLSTNGRVVVRKSGTEPVIRVMAEAYAKPDAEDAVDKIIQAIEQTDEML